MTNIIAGQEVLIKTPSRGRFRFYGWNTTVATVTRVTKARIFVRAVGANLAGQDHSEREFNKSDLTERTAISAHHRSELVVDAAEIADIRAKQAAEKARRALEGDGAAAFVQLASKFSPEPHQGFRPLEGRTDDEIKALIAAVDTLMGLVK